MKKTQILARAPTKAVGKLQHAITNVNPVQRKKAASWSRRTYCKRNIDSHSAKARRLTTLMRLSQRPGSPVVFSSQHNPPLLAYLRLKIFTRLLIERSPGDFLKKSSLDGGVPPQLRQVQNKVCRLTSAGRRVECCVEYHYESGNLLEYYYEKQILLNLAFGYHPARAFNLLVLQGLPSYTQTHLLAMDLDNREDNLLKSLERLKPMAVRAANLVTVEHRTEEVDD
ncbi:unnamed protein product, partial [Nesidiocoris tenuis]